MIFEKDGFLPSEYLERYSGLNYPQDYIIDYAMNPEVSEYESALHGNYSAPVQEQDFLDWIKHRWLPELKVMMLGEEYEHDHHYVNYHMDDEESWLETHNDMKGFRWLITSQIYLNKSQGVVIGDRTIPCRENYMYALLASPYSWHHVPELINLKKSILFRVGKKRHRTVLNYNYDEPAWLIVNDDHSDRHYAKIGPRMGNLTEAWLINQGKYNIYHTDWRASYVDMHAKLLERHKTVCVIPSGEFPGLGDVRVTDENIDAVAHEIFNPGTGIISQAEAVMKEHYHNRLHLNYRSIGL